MATTPWGCRMMMELPWTCGSLALATSSQNSSCSACGQGVVSSPGRTVLMAT